MNIFQSIYCNQYEELVRTGRDGAKARKNGIIIITVAILMNLCTLILLLVIAGRASFLEGPMHWIAESGFSGRGFGKLLALVLMVVIGALVFATFGKESYFDKTIQTFKTLPTEEQKSVAKKGAVYFLGSIGVFLVLFVVMLIAKD